MSQARFTSTGRAYGLKRVCALWGLARSTVYAQRRREAVPVHERPTPNKRGPVGPCTDAELLGHIRQVLEDSPFHGEGYRKVWARLRFAGIRTSKERVRRLMREAGLQAPHRVGKPRGPKAHNGTIRTERPDRMWGTDMTTTVTTEEGMASVGVDPVWWTPDDLGVKEVFTMPQTHPRYPMEFRCQMVELVRAGRTPEALAHEFEPSAQTIRTWAHQADVDEGRRKDGLTSDEREELRRLRRDNRQLRQEREILAKAATWFARETDSIPSGSTGS